MNRRMLSPISRALGFTALAAFGPSLGGCTGAELPADEADTRTEGVLDQGKVYEIVSVHSGRALDVTGKSVADGAKIQQWGYGGGANQKWTLQAGDQGAYRLVSSGSGKCLDVTDWSTNDGARIQQWSCSGGENQEWKLQADGQGAYRIVSASSGKCLDVNGASTSDGAAVQQWGCWGGDNQRWKLVAVGGAQGGGGSPGGKIEFAPYFETWAWGDGSYPFKSLVEMRSKAGVSGATLAFVLSDGGCHATHDIQDHQGDVNAFRSAGGLVKASFGGASGDYLDAKCGSSGALAGAIVSFVDETGITDLDFDVEQGPVMTASMNKKRGAALKAAQDQRGIKVSFTLPVMPSGLDGTGIDVVLRAVQAGVQISHVNLMVMDYGPDDKGSMSGYAKQALTATHGQLLGIVPGLDDAAAWRMLGATPMIGQNDQEGEVFTLGDAQSLLGFAQQKQIGLLSFWAIQRDRPGADYNEASTVNSKNYQFSDVFKAVQ